MVNCNSSRTPVDTESKLGDTGDIFPDPTLYRSLAGSLQYLTFTRPYISYAVQQLFSSSTTDLVAYSDADWAGCPTTRRSTSVMESLHISFQRVVDAGLFKGIKLGSFLQMPHLFYADDAIFMGQWNQSNIDTITQVLDVFYRASGLRINMHKSKLMGISVDANLVKQAASKIGCMVLKTPFKYLGSRVGDLRSRIQSWCNISDFHVFDGVVSIPAWIFISNWELPAKVDCVCLLVSIGMSCRDYIGDFEGVYRGVDIIEVMEARLSSPYAGATKIGVYKGEIFNGTDVKSRKPSWVRWKSVIASKDAGGLGVSSLFALNRALMLQNGVVVYLNKKSHYGLGGFPLYTILQSCPLKFHYFELGINGLNTSFWDVPWRGDTALKELAPRIYALETLKDISVAVKLSHGGLDQSLHRNPRGGAEQVQLEMLQDMIHGCMLSNSNDRWLWSLNGGGDFTVSSVRKEIDNHILPKGITKTRWIKEVPIKINIHAWKVKNDCFPTRFNMSRRGMQIDSILCPLCNSMAESSRHMFFSCNFIRDIMLKINRWWEVDHREFDSYDEWLELLASIRLPMKVKKVFEGICVIVWWYTWNWRNKKIFGHETSPKARIFDEIVSRSFHWIRFRSTSGRGGICGPFIAMCVISVAFGLANAYVQAKLGISKDISGTSHYDVCLGGSSARRLDTVGAS
ncbi:RNA-directed DNA polymerase, eukaryota, reverse transcriptase zinc-binding domain protein [Tanacetum coccineum]